MLQDCRNSEQVLVKDVILIQTQIDEIRKEESNNSKKKKLTENQTRDFRRNFHRKILSRFRRIVVAHMERDKDSEEPANRRRDDGSMEAMNR